MGSTVSFMAWYLPLTSTVWYLSPYGKSYNKVETIDHKPCSNGTVRFRGTTPKKGANLRDFFP
jgi:hypothetical protein